MCCSKFILFTTNTILFVLGIIVIAVASVVINRGNEYGELLMDGVLTLPIIILIVGIFITVLGFLGCFGALKESKCMLYTYSAVVLVFFVAEVALAIFILVHPNASRNAMESYMDKQYVKYNLGLDDALVKSIDQMQINLQCCGVENTTSFGNNKIPDSCCSQDSIVTSVTGCNKINSYKLGCLDAIIEDLRGIAIALGVSALILAILMFFSMSTACGLARRSNYN